MTAPVASAGQPATGAPSGPAGGAGAVPSAPAGKGPAGSPPDQPGAVAPAPPDGSAGAPGGAEPPGGSAAGSADADYMTPTTLDAQDNSLGPSTVTNGARRQDNLQRSSRFVIGGDQVGRDKFVVMLGDQEPAPLQRLSPLLAKPVRHAFVEPDDWPRVRSAYADKRIVILRAAPGQGKVTAAIRLLQAPSDRRIFNLDRNVDLRQLAHWLNADTDSTDPLPRGAGFLLCEPAGWGDVQGWMLQQLDDVLAGIDARLVLTIGSDAVLADQDLLDHVIDLPPAPDHARVLASHLRWRLGGDAGGGDAEERADRILADDALRAYIEEVFTAGAPRKRAADLALVISQELDGDTVDVARLRDRMAERHTEDFDIWFGGLPDVPSRCLAITLAVLNGLPYEVVVRAARALAERLDGPPEAGGGQQKPRAPWRDPFGLTRRERERLLRARTRQVTSRGPWGPVQVEALEYVDDGYAGMVLEHVWRQYQLHDDLLGWLVELADDRASEEMRVWAGTALGLLSTYAFDVVWTRALAPMAEHDRRYWLREVVAYALRVPAADGRLRPLVENLVASLYANRTLPLGQATAARVYGVSLGPFDAGRALAALDRLAMIDDVRIANGIGDSLADLLLQDQERNAPLVLSHITAWLNDRRRNVAGQYVFLRLADSLTAEVEVAGAPAGGGPHRPSVSWPTLLMLADQHPRLRVVLVGMWQQVMNAGTFTNLTERVLASWAGLAEADQGVRLAFGRMLADVATRSDRSRQLVKRVVAGWRATDNLRPQPLTAYAVEAELSSGRNPR
ncbi:collagen-like triple helix repeat-containing protein [Micromonospora sp. DT233]|uniref:collagen-like triple helix repeat-containing protein n=1 Tax=Micromonospora sp. DT233 TaxID=3393432 RepID=UPI003CEA83DC